LCEKSVDELEGELLLIAIHLVQAAEALESFA
jgi:hypothetical protein